MTPTAVTEAALDIAGRLQKANPRNPFPHNLAGSAHIQAKRYEKARENFLAALTDIAVRLGNKDDAAKRPSP